jgi:hypothetical protein
MDFLREFRGRAGEPVTTDSEDADDDWTPPTREWLPAPERVLGLADLVVGSDASGLSGVDPFVGPAELEAAARGAWAAPAGWGPAAGESVPDLAHRAPEASLSEPAPVSGRPSHLSVPATPRRDVWDRQRSGPVLSLVQGEILLALAATIVSIVVIALIAVH